MVPLDTTVRTKAAVGRWSRRKPSALVLDDKLEKLRPGASGQLRRYVNEEFSGDTNVPISIAEWIALGAKTVRDVRDEVLRRQG